MAAKRGTNSSIPLPANFDQGASAPPVAFDAQQRFYVAFMAVTYAGLPADLDNADTSHGSSRLASQERIFLWKAVT